MGETVAKIKVSGLLPNGTAEFKAVVDTGATYTMLPKAALERLGIQPVRDVTLRLADGRTVTRFLANVLVELEGLTCANTILLGEEGDAALIGLVTLESCGLTVDPVHKQLVPVPEIHHYRASS